MTTFNEEVSNPLNSGEFKLLGTQSTSELDAQLAIAALYMVINPPSSKAIVFQTFNDYYEEFGDSSIIPESTLKEAGRYMSFFKGKIYGIELDVYDWEVINRVRENEKIQNGLEVLISSYFYVQDFISFLDGRGSIFEYPSLNYACSQLRQRGDEESLYLADFFKNEKLIFPNPNFKDSI